MLYINLFYSRADTITFVEAVGVLINKKMVYNPNHNIINNDHFSLSWSKYILLLFLRKRRKIILSLRHIKFYKFRSKIKISKFRTLWVPSTTWIQEHAYIYIYKHASIEFDLRVLVGFFIYTYNFRQFNHFLSYINLSLFMSRSYNWKYII